MYVCMYACMYVCIYKGLDGVNVVVNGLGHANNGEIVADVCMYVCMYVCVYIQRA